VEEIAKKFYFNDFIFIFIFIFRKKRMKILFLGKLGAFRK